MFFTIWTHTTFQSIIPWPQGLFLKNVYIAGVFTSILPNMFMGADAADRALEKYRKWPSMGNSIAVSIYGAVIGGASAAIFPISTPLLFYLNEKQGN